MKNVVTSLVLAASLTLSGCALAHKKYTRRVEAMLADTDSPGAHLAAAIRYAAQQEIPTSETQ